MLFWHTRPDLEDDGIAVIERSGLWLGGSAWLYTNANPKYCVGTSLCYWRRVWQRQPFPALPKGPTGAGEDTQWLAGVDSLGVLSCHPQLPGIHVPRMIASVHGGNTTSIAALGIKHGTAPEWRRATEWDSYCREAMNL